MKKTLSLTLSFAVAFLGVATAAAPSARAQEVASAGNSISKIREDYERLLAVERNPETPPEVREMNQNFLNQRRAQLVAALRTRINALRMYQASLVSTLSGDENQAVEKSVSRLIEELQALEPQKEAPAAPARRARSSQTVTASFEAAPAEPARRAPASSGGPLEITSPERDKVVHVSEIEVEVAVNDDQIDDLMVAVYTANNEKPRSARVLNLKRSDKGTKSVVVALSQGDNRIEVRDLKRGDIKSERMITYRIPEAPSVGNAAAALAQDSGSGGGGAAARETTQPQDFPEYDWGRVRAYFAGGVIMSKENENFSQNDVFLDFTIDKNYFASSKRRLLKDFNTFFNARLTSIPVSQPTPAPEGTDGEGGEDGEDGEDTDDDTPCNTPDCINFVSSEKAALLQAGVYLPIYGKYTSWLRRIPVEQEDVTKRDPSKGTRTVERRYNYERNALFVAPLAKGGIQTIIGDRLTTTSEGRQFNGDDVFNFYSFGAMLGHYRIPTRRVQCTARKDAKGNDAYDRDCIVSRDGNRAYRYIRNTNLAPELISWLTLTTGRWESFNIQVPTGEEDAEGNPIKRPIRPWRYEALGRLKIPNGPFIVGFDGNFGKGPDDLRFIFGMRFDIGKVFNTLRIGQAAKEPTETADPPETPDK